MQIPGDFPHYSKICNILRSSGVSYAGLFGSRAFGDNKPDSDYDILVEFVSGSNKTLLGVIELKQKLEDILEKKVDLVTPKGLSPYLRDGILNHVVSLYGQKN
jgi:predicted nucleotidyltransferase